jgi:hypothetical protein
LKTGKAVVEKQWYDDLAKDPVKLEAWYVASLLITNSILHNLYMVNMVGVRTKYNRHLQMRSLSSSRDEAFATMFDFSRYNHVMDVGGSTATLSIRLAQMHPHLYVIACSRFAFLFAPFGGSHLLLYLVEWDCIENARHMIWHQLNRWHASLSTKPNYKTVSLVAHTPCIHPFFFSLSFLINESVCRFIVATGNMWSDVSWPRGADVIVMGFILHNYDTAKKIALCRRAYETLPSGGVMVILEIYADDERRTGNAGYSISQFHSMVTLLNIIYCYEPIQID